MDPITLAALASIAAPVVGGVVGQRAAKKDSAKQQELLEQAMGQYDGIALPKYNEQLPAAPAYGALPALPDLLTDAPDAPNYQTLNPVELERYRSVGQLDPRMEQALTQGDTELRGISVDPKYKAAQLQALAKLQEISDGKGMTAEDRARLARIQGEVAQASKGRREAIMQNMAARGAGGSGMELLAQLQNDQAATDRAAQQSLEVEAMAERRALEALMQGANLAGDMGNTDFARQAKIAEAQDIINRFNTANRQDVTGRNVDRGNRGDEINLKSAQDIANANVGVGNQQIGMNREGMQYNNSLLGQSYDDRLRGGAFANDARLRGYGAAAGRTELADSRLDKTHGRQVDAIKYGNAMKTQGLNDQMGLAGGKAGVLSSGAGYYGNQAASTRAMYGGIGQGVGTGLLGAGKLMAGGGAASTSTQTPEQWAGDDKGKQDFNDFLKRRK